MQKEKQKRFAKYLALIQSYQKIAGRAIKAARSANSRILPLLLYFKYMDAVNDNYFQISVKGLFFKDGKLMMIQEPNGLWELPGGRIQKGENFADCLKRECQEEIGVECEILDTQPYIVYPSVDGAGRGRIMVFFRISLASMDFRPSDEFSKMDFFEKGEIAKLPKYPQSELLPKYL